MRKEIKILHSSCCSHGSPIKAHIEKIAAQKKVEVVVDELSDLKDTMVFGTMTFPSLVIDGKVYAYKNYSKDELLASIL